MFADGLPTFKSYVDCLYEKGAGQTIRTRLFIDHPTADDIEATTAIHKADPSSIAVIGAVMPYMPGKQSATPTPLYRALIGEGFSEDFASTLSRIVIYFFEGKSYSKAYVSATLRGLRELRRHLLETFKNVSEVTSIDLGKDVWLSFLSKVIRDKRTSNKSIFNCARAMFVKYEQTALGGWLERLRFRSRNNPESSEHTSELSQARDYPDAVMYQLLAFFVEGFQRRMGYLKHYVELSEEDMPDDWVYPGRVPIKHKPKSYIGTDVNAILYGWLNNEEEGYQILIDHHLIYHKAGLIKRTNGGNRGGFRPKLVNIAGKTGKQHHRPEVQEALDRFFRTMGDWHGFGYPNTIVSLLQFYLKRSSSGEVNNTMDQISFCLANLLMMQTGINKEVALSIPSRSEDGSSILARQESLFITDDGSPEIELYGVKEKTGNSPRKIIPIPIAKSSPLYDMLIQYERDFKIDPDGPFFELSPSFTARWTTAGRVSNFQQLYPALNENGTPLESIDTTKFRKVFASGRLLEHLNSVKDANELADRIKEDLTHGNLDITLVNYLYKASASISVIDTAIATITSEKLEEGLSFRGRVELSHKKSEGRKVFLCDCEDPTNPSHDIAIAEECKHYDLCLGCERSVITKEHLPFICARILQYEEARKKDAHIWPAMYEDRWSIAHNALEHYADSDKNRGKELVEQAWAVARSGRASLPPIIISNRL